MYKSKHIMNQSILSKTEHIMARQGVFNLATNHSEHVHFEWKYYIQVWGHT